MGEFLGTEDDSEGVEVPTVGVEGGVVTVVFGNAVDTMTVKTAIDTGVLHRGYGKPAKTATPKGVRHLLGEAEGGSNVYSEGHFGTRVAEVLSEVEGHDPSRFIGGTDSEVD